MTSPRPNILLIVCDQLRGDWLDHDFMEEAWNIRELKREGVSFNRAYSSAATCAPARRTLMSGRTPSHHGVLDSDWRRDFNGPTLAGILSAQGYATHLVGKSHLWPNPESWGFQSSTSSDGIAPEVMSDYTRFVVTAAQDAPWASTAHKWYQNSRRVCTWALPEELHFSSWCASEAIRFIREHDGRLPYFLAVNFLAPHPPMLPLPHLLEKYRSRNIVAPIQSEWSEHLAVPIRDNDRYVAWRGQLEASDMLELRAAYSAMVEQVDRNIGLLLAAICENTAIIFTSDHGDMLGDHNLFHKCAPYESATRIPLVVSWPRNCPDRPLGGVVNTPVELIDVVPTVLELTQTLTLPRLDGESLVPLAGGLPSRRKYLYGKNANCPSLRSPMEFIVDQQWKFIYFEALELEQLFHLVVDPQETVDLSDRAEFRTVLQIMRERLMASRGESTSGEHMSA